MPKILTIREYLDSMNQSLQPLANKLTDVLDDSLLKSTATIWHGHPVWMTGKMPVAGFKAHTSHVTFMVWKGQLITDRSGSLQPAGSSGMANLKIFDADQIDPNIFANWLHQAEALELP